MFTILDHRNYLEYIQQTTYSLLIDKITSYIIKTDLK